MLPVVFILADLDLAVLGTEGLWTFALAEHSFWPVDLKLRFLSFLSKLCQQCELCPCTYSVLAKQLWLLSWAPWVKLMSSTLYTSSQINAAALHSPRQALRLVIDTSSLTTARCLFQTGVPCRYQKVNGGRALTETEISGLLIATLFAGQHTSSITTTWTGLRMYDNRVSVCGTCSKP